MIFKNSLYIMILDTRERGCDIVDLFGNEHAIVFNPLWNIFGSHSQSVAKKGASIWRVERFTYLWEYRQYLWGNLIPCHQYNSNKFSCSPYNLTLRICGFSVQVYTIVSSSLRVWKIDFILLSCKL